MNWKTSGGIGMVAAASLLALTACGKPSTGGAAASGSLDLITTPPATAAVKQVTWALPYGEPASLHWLKALAFSDSTVLANLCEGLTRTTPNLGTELALAESVKRPNGTTIVYELRQGVTFTNGDPLTPEDVVFSLEQNLSPTVGSFWAEWFKNVKSIKATGAREVTITLSQPDAAFEEFLATAGGAIVQKKYAQAKGAAYGTASGGVMCTGPYTLDHWTSGSEIVLTANPHYWDTAHQPKVGRINFKFITNATTLADGLRAGEIDGTFELPFGAIGTLRSSGVGQVYLGKSLGYTSLEFTGKRGPANDVRVRQALSLAMDREALAKVVFHGAAQPIKSLFFPSTWGYGTGTYEKAYHALTGSTKADLEKAKQLVTQTGATAEMTVLSNADDPTAKQLAAYLKSQAESVGLKIKLTELPAAQWIAAEFDPKRLNAYDITITTTGYLDVPDPIEWGVYTLSKGGIFNPSNYDNADVNRWIEQARAAADPDVRAQLMTKVQQQAYGTDFASVPLVNTASALFLSKKLSGVPVSLNAHLYYPWARDLGGVR